MINLLQIKRTINKKLKDKFPDIKIYSNETKEGFKRPAFFTQIVPAVFDYETVNFASNKLIIVINYFSKNKTELENIKMNDSLIRAFGMTLKVSHRSFLIKNIRSEIVDEVLQFKFDLDFYTSTGIGKEEYQIMEELKMNLGE